MLNSAVLYISMHKLIALSLMGFILVFMDAALQAKGILLNGQIHIESYLEKPGPVLPFGRVK